MKQDYWLIAGGAAVFIGKGFDIYGDLGDDQPLLRGLMVVTVAGLFKLYWWAFERAVS